MGVLAWTISNTNCSSSSLFSVSLSFFVLVVPQALPVGQPLLHRQTIIPHQPHPSHPRQRQQYRHRPIVRRIRQLAQLLCRVSDWVHTQIFSLRHNQTPSLSSIATMSQQVKRHRSSLFLKQCNTLRLRSPASQMTGNGSSFRE